MTQPVVVCKRKLKNVKDTYGTIICIDYKHYNHEAMVNKSPQVNLDDFYTYDDSPIFETTVRAAKKRLSKIGLLQCSEKIRNLVPLQCIPEKKTNPYSVAIYFKFST